MKWLFTKTYVKISQITSDHYLLFLNKEKIVPLLGKLDGLVAEGDVLQGGPTSQQLEVWVVKHYVVVVGSDVQDGDVVIEVEFIFI